MPQLMWTSAELWEQCVFVRTQHRGSLRLPNAGQPSEASLAAERRLSSGIRTPAMASHWFITPVNAFRDSGGLDPNDADALLNTINVLGFHNDWADQQSGKWPPTILQDGVEAWKRYEGMWQPSWAL
ncbi:hypothetical protein HPB50_016780 [Hyalomma asiaticum]|uniref:Uncharacterized protein n=1 Tax=Hyalomma asiaticum TaxID=266040 RepID=A0ACB7S3M2_HYAAI|nr:hypothetical protein HPB50_016780 [Hyalomma asiaticum]